MKLTQVFFWALPIGCGFWHKNGWHVKTDEEEAYRVGDRRYVFEIHYGCAITQELGASLQLPRNAYRDDGPLPAEKNYIERLFGAQRG